eukprot:TRINITY_DN49904_c0_g1_i1.p1 TRINITY_DN49904_c0_g1~~TRINITY_DN49904_c0_g1_i1.p1  ORF type:complete len:1178 (+),score=234.49 TRINITY_DN49904_c0_g1_i1:92-3535(+)
MELLMAAGLGAKELFTYNRENFKFDQDQRIEREALRLEMQVKRFELFREDVRDLVELTVDRMDVYHLVGALFLEFCIVLFCEGRVQASAPPFLLSLFLLSNACAFIYLLLAVWLSMHASIASHSFGVRLLTRFVRLPIPSMKQITNLRSTLKDYERQGIANLLRLPFQDQQEWQQVHGVDETPGKGETSRPQGDVNTTQPRAASSLAPPVAGEGSASSSSAGMAKSPRTGNALSAPMATTIGKQNSPRGPAPASLKSGQNLLPERDENVLGGEDLLNSSGAAPERHVQLFRQLQSKWQCYDAYCRVCMGLGVNQILQGLSYYCICHTLVENRSPTTGYALVTLFQSTTIALAVLDLAGLKRREILAVQVVGIMPCLLTAWGVAHGKRNEAGELDPDQTYMLSPLSFLCQVLWLELWLRVAAPDGGDQAKLPRRFRQVLFLDVFGDSSGWDPQDSNNDCEDDTMVGEMFNDLNKEEDKDDSEDEALVAAAQRAASQLTMAQCGIRRWRAVPEWALSLVQRKELSSLLDQLTNWSNTVRTELERCRRLPGIAEALRNLDAESRQWSELSPEDRSADPFAGCLLGPFEHDDGYKMACYHFDIESQQCLFDDNASKMCPGALVLSLQAVSALMKDVEEAARNLLEHRIMTDLRVTMHRRNRQSDIEKEKQKAALILPGVRSVASGTLERKESFKGSFPNLVGLFKQRLHQRADDGEARLELLSSSSPAAQASIPEVPEDGDASESMGAAGGSFSSSSMPSRAPEPHVGSCRYCGNVYMSDAQYCRKCGKKRENDPTLVAMAGENAKHFVPERLPWQVLRNITRVLQVCWFWSGVMAFLKEVHVYQVDFQQHPGGERRLCHIEDWKFEHVDVDWPHGSFFRPQGLYCVSSSTADFFVASPFAVYASRLSVGAEPVQLEEVSRWRMPRSSAACAGLPGLQGCLLVAAGQDSLEVWPAVSSRLGPDTVTLKSADGAPWKLVAASAVHCESVARLLPSEEVGVAEWCLLLAGWDGSMLPVAAVPLPRGPGSPPMADAVVRAGLDVPLEADDAKKGVPGVLALHLEPTEGRLWALLSTGDIEAWDLLGSHSHGRWRPEWPAAFGTGFQPVAICEDSSLGVLVLSHSGRGGGAVLARAPLPSRVNSSIASIPTRVNL